MFVLKHFLYSDVISRLKMRNVKNEYLFTNRNTKEIKLLRCFKYEELLSMINTRITVLHVN